jgi:undecaprenyl-diphosphatase
LVSKLLGIVPTEFTKSFEIFIQLGAIMAVVTLYARTVFQKPQIIKPLFYAFLPTGLLGFLFYKNVKMYLLGNSAIVVFMLASIGLAMILIERYWTKHPPTSDKTVLTLSPMQLILIGYFQSFAMIPGVSRAATTIIGGMIIGLPRVDAVEFSFLLAVPTLATATGLDLVKSFDAIRSGNLTLLIVGFFVSWIVAAIVIRTFVKYIQYASFTTFGIYRIIVAFLFWMFVR